MHTGDAKKSSCTGCNNREQKIKTEKEKEEEFIMFKSALKVIGIIAGVAAGLVAAFYLMLFITAWL